MGQPAFSAERLIRNLSVLAALSPEVACWLQMSGPDGQPCPPAASLAGPAPMPWPRGHQPRPGGITVVVGGGDLAAVRRLLESMPEGHQVFMLEPRAELLREGLGQHDLGRHLENEDLVILAPGEMSLERAMARHPQLALAEQVELVDLFTESGDAQAAAVRARLYRVLGHALKARDLALKWEYSRGNNLIYNLPHVALMGAAPSLVGSAKGRPALLVEHGPSLDPLLERLAGNLGPVALFCSDRALPRLLEAGVVPSACVLTSPAAGALFGYDHPLLARVPLVAEEVAHAPTVMSHPGPRFICLGPRGTDFGPLKTLGNWFTPQHHTLGRSAELAAACGCKPLILAGCDLTCPKGELKLPAMDGGSVTADLEQTAAACSLGQVLSRIGGTALNLSSRGLGLPGTKTVSLDEVLPLLAGEGGPLRPPALAGLSWLDAGQMAGFLRGVQQAAATATLLWQRAAAPSADLPHLTPDQAEAWLTAADGLFVALAEQAAADHLQAAFLEGCLVRAFLRRHRLLCNSEDGKVKVDDACRELGRCLGDLKNRAGELARGLKQTAVMFVELSRALEEGDGEHLASFARSLGRPAPPARRPGAAG